VTAGAIPVSAGDPDLAQALLVELADPELAAITTEANGYATPNDAARALLPAALRHDRVLFPREHVLERCHTFHDLGADEVKLLRVYEAVAAA
jgi:spermidine/putrescine transport system substrate-binding protein